MTEGTDVFLTWATSSSVPRDDGWLTDAELEVRRGLTVPKRVADWRLGRWVGKEVVRRALNVPDLSGRDVEILASPGGAPTVAVLSSGGWPEVRLSLSHAWGMGLAGALVGTASIGCDVEAVRPRSDAFVSDYLTAAEATFVRDAEAAEQATRANLVWSAKESVLKALGEGLRLDTRSVEVSIGGHAPVDGWRTFNVSVPGGESLRGRWRVTTGFVWTLALGAAVGRLRAKPVR